MVDIQKQIVTVGVTGASGAILAQKTLALLEEDLRVARVHLVVTEAGQRLFAEELGIASGDLKQLPSRMLGHAVAKIDVLPNKDVGASIASDRKSTRLNSSHITISYAVFCLKKKKKKKQKTI